MCPKHRKGNSPKKHSSLKNSTLTTCKEDQREPLVCLARYLLLAFPSELTGFVHPSCSVSAERQNDGERSSMSLAPPSQLFLFQGRADELIYRKACQALHMVCNINRSHLRHISKIEEACPPQSLLKQKFSPEKQASHLCFRLLRELQDVVCEDFNLWQIEMNSGLSKKIICQN